MVMFATPEEHAANPPSTWEVRKPTYRNEKPIPRLWHLTTKDGTVLERAKTRREAEALREDSFAARLYEKERRWYAGEQVDNWKSYEQCRDERQALAERQAQA
jgi:hypothetical protein